MKYRTPEQNLYERVSRTDNSKKPDAIVSNINGPQFSYTKMIGEVKPDSFDKDSISVLYDKYRLALFGKDCVDSGTENVILFQAIGKSFSLNIYILYCLG